MVIVICLVHGRPKVLMDENLEEPAVWFGIDDAIAETSAHTLVLASEAVHILDCETGERETL